MLQSPHIRRIGGSRFIVLSSMVVTGLVGQFTLAPANAGEGDDRPPAGGQSLTGGNPLALSTPAGASGFGWLGAETNYKESPVECNGVNIGRLDFKYRPYRETGWNPDAGGAALEGGFTANGMDPCLFGQQPGTEYYWVQTIVTNRPAAGRGPGEYTDSRNPRRDPAYPHGSDNNNPARNPFTGRSYYDAPRRSEEAARDVDWLAENMLCCRVDRKINVIGSFLWGFTIDADGMPNDGTVNIIENGRHAWGPATNSAIDTVAKEARGTRTEQGWSISTGCCCNKWFPFLCFSAITGLTDVELFTGDPNMVLDQVLIFPRNHPVVDFLPAPPGWFAQPWGGNIAPILPYQTQGLPMFQNGILFINENPMPGAEFHQFQIHLAGHESFLDVYMHDAASNQWVPWTMQSQELLGDMNGDDLVDVNDVPVWQLAFNDPVAYQNLYPGQDPVFRGDLSHNGVLELVDLAMLQQMVNLQLEYDGRPMSPPCPADIAPPGGDIIVGVPDLLAVINGWGPCPVSGCIADFTNDNQVGVPDLLFVINDWGPCDP